MPYEIKVCRDAGGFGDTTDHHKMEQAKLCEKCRMVQTRIVSEGVRVKTPSA
jgi:hypothetical protein